MIKAAPPYAERQENPANYCRQAGSCGTSLNLYGWILMYQIIIVKPTILVAHE
jgi:hypothetical protein